MSQYGGVWTREDRAGQPHQYLPVEVPAGCPGLTVTLDYDRSAGAIDLGCLGPAGFRGWSGTARDRFAIGPAAATPGYLPGELEPGTWAVMLGLHRIGPDGVRWRVTVRLGPVRPPEASAAPVPRVTGRPPARDLPHEPGLRWLAGDPHTHTVHSDGALTVSELAALGASRGLDFLAVTDHNTVSQHAELGPAGAAAGVVLLPGQEVTTDRGHAGVLGEVGWIDFREPADRWLAESERRGGLMSVNHPLAADCAWRQPLGRRPPLAEVWHWTWLDRRWGGPVAWWMAWVGWTASVSDPAGTGSAAGPVAPVGGSDWHRPGSDAPPGQPTTWVACAERSVEGVLDGLRAGRTAVSADRDGPVLLPVAGELVVLGGDGLLLAGPDGRRAPVRGDRARFSARPGPHLVTDHDGAVLALCG
ncbi:MAG TPA: CehA/McbA family metallohydrolase [Mycobacteriales bacterium]|nr:CehA/McbA family metallohydrolase [Mycobacteriales bacterium]